MPDTKFQKLVFAFLMVLVMVYFMTLYNTFRNSGLAYDTFIYPLFIMWPEVAVALVIQKFIGGPAVARILPYIISAKKAKRVYLAAAMGVCMVLVMAPCMTLFVCIMHNGLSARLPLIWG